MIWHCIIASTTTLQGNRVSSGRRKESCWQTFSFRSDMTSHTVEVNKERTRWFAGTIHIHGYILSVCGRPSGCTDLYPMRVVRRASAVPACDRA